MSDQQYEQPELPFGDELPPSDQFKLKDFNGCAVLIAVGGYHREVQTRYDPKPAVAATVVVLNGPRGGDIYDDVLVFNTRPVRTLRGVPGRAFVAHVDIDNTTSNPSVVLLDPSPEEYQLARDWHGTNPDLCNDLVKEAVRAYEEREAKLAAPMPRQAQQQTRSAPPTGPNYGRSTLAATSADDGPPPPPPESRRSAQLPSGQPFDAVPPSEPGEDEPPF